MNMPKKWKVSRCLIYKNCWVSENACKQYWRKWKKVGRAKLKANRAGYYNKQGGKRLQMPNEERNCFSVKKLEVTSSKLII